MTYILDYPAKRVVAIEGFELPEETGVTQKELSVNHRN